MEESNWKLVYNGFDPSEEGLREALCTLGNGYMGVRGAAYESAANKIHYPGTYLASGYNKVATHIEGKTIYNEDLVNFPNWIPITFKIGDGEWFSPSRSKIRFYRQELDMRKGALIRRMRFQNRKGQKTSVEAVRIVSMDNPHIGAIKYIITPENYSDWITVKTMIDGAVINSGVERYRQLNSKHLIPSALGNFSVNGMYLSMKTTQSKIHVAEAARTCVFVSGRQKKLKVKHQSRGRETIEQVFKVFAAQGEPVDIEKVVSICTSKDEGARDPVALVIDMVKDAGRFEDLYNTHIEAWDVLWKGFDIQIELDHFSQKALRLHMFHLLQTASPHMSNFDAGLPARGIHGEAYRGHVFWDSIYAMAFYDLHMPDISKALLLYRYRRLHQARKYAKKNGFRGAMFPWQSASTGEEETQVVHLNPLSAEWGLDYSRNQRHVSLAIAYNVWQYYIRTADEEFLGGYGAEILLSIAQFFASLVYFDSKDEKYHTQGVMGPDEFHEKYPGEDTPGLRDNAYTNLMIAWLLLRAKDVIAALGERDKRRIFRRVGLKPHDLELWDDIVCKMNVVINQEGIIAQFDGYFDLKELNWEKYKERYESIERLDRILKAEGKSPDEYKISKQADVLMLFYLLPLYEIKTLFKKLGYHLDKDILNRNYKYYIKRTSHGSTLSKVVHCYIAHILGKPKEAWRWFGEVMESDIFDVQGGTTFEGIHAGVMGGSIDILVRGFAGIDVSKNRIRVIPKIPRRWNRIKLRINYKGYWISFSVTNKQVTVFIQGGREEFFPVPLEINSKLYSILCGKRHRFPIKT
ncbi:MAG: glycosyl hydrolase family 65 protein [Candidatus Saelkia tenebricola]|nr:glycosyl hydrolase family 65 protein [Candidatus Saelkia tenebricola]